MNPPLIVAFIRAADWLPVTTSWAGGRNFLRVTMLVLLAGLAVDAQATPYAYLTTSGANVSVFDLATNAVERTLTLPGSAGTGVAVNRQSTRVYLAGVPSRGIQIPSLHVIDATTNTVLPSIALNGPSGAQWSGVAVNPAGDRVYVAQPTGRYIAVVDPGTSQVLTTIAVSGSPGNLALNASGTRLYVANASSGAGDSVLVLDTQTYATIATVPVTSGPSDLRHQPSRHSPVRDPSSVQHSLSG